MDGISKSKIPSFFHRRKEGSIYYQVIHNRVVRHIRTDYRIFESEWNGKLSMIDIPTMLPAERKHHLG